MMCWLNKTGPTRAESQSNSKSQHPDASGRTKQARPASMAMAVQALTATRQQQPAEEESIPSIVRPDAKGEQVIEVQLLLNVNY